MMLLYIQFYSQMIYKILYNISITYWKLIPFYLTINSGFTTFFKTAV